VVRSNSRASGLSRVARVGAKTQRLLGGEDSNVRLADPESAEENSGVIATNVGKQRDSTKRIGDAAGTARQISRACSQTKALRSARRTSEPLPQMPGENTLRTILTR